jgi:hypothetical protein
MNASDNRYSSLIEAIVESSPFQQERIEAEKTAN